MRLSVATLPFAAFIASAAPAACLESDYTVRGEFGRADYVAQVRVEQETWLDENWRPTKLKPPLGLGSMPRGLDPYAGANYRVTLRQTLKGDLPKSFNIFSENTSARTPLVVGHNYIVFLHRAPNSDEYVRAGALTIDNCGNSGPLAQKHGIVAEVRQLAEGSRFATERR